MADLQGRHLGRYRLGELLGRGGMAEVYQAHDEKLDRAVAVKIIRPVHAEDEGFLERFLREARLVAQLEHPHILPVYDFGEEQGRPYLVMPLVHGGTLLERLKMASPPRALISEWLEQLGSALDAAHAKGILHRDIKPANVLVGDGDRLLLADFGIARMWHSSTGLTATGTVVGTPLYLAPEVAQGAKATPASDRYSLAVVAYEMIGGSPPFQAENPLSILHQHVTRPVPELTLRMGDLPREVDTVFIRALAKTPEERPQSGKELASVVRAVLSGEDVERTLPLPAANVRHPPTRPPLPSAPTVSQSEGEATPPPPTVVQRFGRGLLWSLSVVVLVLVGLSALKILQRGDLPSVETAEVAQRVDEPAVAEVLEPPGEESMVEPRDLATHETSKTGEQESVADDIDPPREPPSRASSEDVETPTAARRRRPPPGGSLAEGETWKTLDRRLSRSDFQRMKEAAAGRSPHPHAKLAEDYASGGLAYVEGRSSEAVSTLVRLLSDERSALAWGGSVATLLREMVGSGERLMAWQVDLAYGDPGRQAEARLSQARAEQPESLALALGEAVLARLDGDHRKAIERARKVWDDERLVEHRSVVAQFIAEQYVLVGNARDTMVWYKRAVEHGGTRAPFVAFQAARSVARDLGRPEEAALFMKVACENGLQVACREIDRAGRSLARRRRNG